MGGQGNKPPRGGCAQASALRANSQADAEGASESAQMALLWDRLQAANAALPAELKLAPEAGVPAGLAPAVPEFLSWLRAPNGAGLGWTGIAIRYVWPEKNQRKSYNFWIRWKAGVGYMVSHRGVHRAVWRSWTTSSSMSWRSIEWSGNWSPASGSRSGRFASGASGPSDSSPS